MIEFVMIGLISIACALLLGIDHVLEKKLKPLKIKLRRLKNE